MVRIAGIAMFLAGLLVFGMPLAQQRPAVAPAPAAEQRVALVIGNASYKNSPLANPVNDARDMAVALSALGFKVTLKEDADQRSMKQAVREFGERLKAGGIGLFYFAGHGIQAKGRNYLIPVDEDIAAEDEVEDQSMDVNLVLDKMESAQNRLNVVILDACRNNPFQRRFRSASRGLAPLDAAKGTFIAFATAPGTTASDGSGRNGIYTKHLLASLRMPESAIETVFKRVRADVLAETGGRQVPWESSSLVGDFYFNPNTVPGTQSVAFAPPPGETPLSVEIAFWQSVQSGTGAAGYEAYLKRYADGQFADIAKIRLASLRTAPGPLTPPPAATPRTATVIFARRSGLVSSGVDAQVFHKEKLAGTLPSGSFFRYEAPAGEQTFYIQNQFPVRITIEADRTYLINVEAHWFGNFSAALGRGDDAGQVVRELRDTTIGRLN